ncbi:N-acyl homoserine lactonase family protein [Actinoallomurus acaciae]|uniref:N-acyl homoserine lactonase family protein n=1 Tax=Actinoallomurus acaciae TaxID=502577 RepID=A0ABV5YCT6_9ACTN
MSAPHEVIAVRYGTRATRKSEVYLHFGLYGEPDAPTDMDYFFWVVRGAGRTVLVDCGFNERSGTRRGRTMLCPPAEALARLGVRPADVSQVVVTHAHYDHIGNLDLFPSAEVVIARREYAFWTGPVADRPLFMTSAEADDLDALRRAVEDGRVSLVEGRHTVAPGIEVLEVGGHTPGQLVVLVTSADGDVVIASDALHYYEELELDRPFTHVADLPAMYAGFETLRELAGDGRPLVAGHDPEVMRRFPALTGEAAGLAVRVGGEAGR